MNKVRRLQRELDVRGRDLEVEEQESAGFTVDTAGNFYINYEKKDISQIGSVF